MKSEKKNYIKNKLEEVKNKRGYLLPHHGLLSITDPLLLSGYDQCYSALTLKKRHLNEKNKEFIWLGILAVTEEHIATQHVKKFLNAGGSSEAIQTIIQLASYAKGVSSIIFSHSYWKVIDNNIDQKKLYFNGLNLLNKNKIITDILLNLSMLAIHTSIKNHLPLKWHIKELYSLKVKEVIIAEALSYSMFTGSIPNYIEGCSVWQEMIKEKEINASEEFIEWAFMDQSGPSNN